MSRHPPEGAIRQLIDYVLGPTEPEALGLLRLSELLHKREPLVDAEVAELCRLLPEPSGRWDWHPKATRLNSPDTSRNGNHLRRRNQDAKRQH